MIKLRAWHKELKQMFDVIKIETRTFDNNLMLGLVEVNKLAGFLDNVPSECTWLMQSTGINDLLGNLIFEGDILTHDHGGGVESFLIERNPDDNQLHVRYLYMPGYNTDYLAESWVKDSIVVGNVWANPDLMVGDDE